MVRSKDKSNKRPNDDAVVTGSEGYNALKNQSKQLIKQKVKRPKRRSPSNIKSRKEGKIKLSAAPTTGREYFTVHTSAKITFTNYEAFKRVRLDETIPVTNVDFAAKMVRNLVPLSICREVESEIDILSKNLPPSKKARVSYCVGDVKLRRKEVSPLKLTMDPTMKQFLKAPSFKALVNIVCEKYKQLFPYECEELEKIVYPSNYFGLFSGMAINISKKQSFHVDKNDWKGHPSSAVISISEFEGGELVLPLHSIQFSMRQGNVVFMRSGEIAHANKHTWQGKRITVVLFLHEAVVKELAV